MSNAGVIVLSLYAISPFIYLAVRKYRPTLEAMFFDMFKVGFWINVAVFGGMIIGRHANYVSEDFFYALGPVWILQLITWLCAFMWCVYRTREV